MDCFKYPIASYDNWKYSVNPIRIVQFMICVLCLAISAYTIVKEVNLGVALYLVLTVTASTFSGITLVDLIANSYWKPIFWNAWIMFATMATCLYFMCVGLLWAVWERMKIMLILGLLGYTFAGIAFLVDVIIILRLLHKRQIEVLPTDDQVMMKAMMQQQEAYAKMQEEQRKRAKDQQQAPSLKEAGDSRDDMSRKSKVTILGARPSGFIDQENGKKYTGEEIMNGEGSGMYKEPSSGAVLTRDQIQRALSGKPHKNSDKLVDKQTKGVVSANYVAKQDPSKMYIDPVTADTLNSDQVRKDLSSVQYQPDDIFNDKEDGAAYTAEEIVYKDAGSGFYIDPRTNETVTRQQIAAGLDNSARPYDEDDEFTDTYNDKIYTAAAIVQGAGAAGATYRDKYSDLVTKEDIERRMRKARPMAADDLLVDTQTGEHFTAAQVARGQGSGVYKDPKTGEIFTRDQVIRRLGAKYKDDDVFIDQASGARLTAQQIANGEGGGLYVDPINGDELTRDQIIIGMGRKRRFRPDDKVTETVSGDGVRAGVVARGQEVGPYKDEMANQILSREEVQSALGNKIYSPDDELLDAETMEKLTADQIAKGEGSGQYADPINDEAMTRQEVLLAMYRPRNYKPDELIKDSSGDEHKASDIVRGKGSSPFTDPKTGEPLTRDDIYDGLHGNRFGRGDEFIDNFDGEKLTADQIAKGQGSDSYMDPVNGEQLTRDQIIAGLGSKKRYKPDDLLTDNKTGNMHKAVKIAAGSGTGLYVDSDGDLVTREQVKEGLGLRQIKPDDMFIDRQTGEHLTAAQIADGQGSGSFTDPVTGEVLTREQIILGLGGKRPLQEGAVYQESDIFMDKKSGDPLTAGRIVRGEGCGVYTDPRTGETVTREQIARGLSMGSRIFLDKNSGLKITVSQIARGDGSGIYIDPRSGVTFTRNQISKCVCKSNGTPSSLSEQLDKEAVRTSSSRTVAVSTRTVPRSSPGRSPRPQSTPCSPESCTKKRPVKSAEAQRSQYQQPPTVVHQFYQKPCPCGKMHYQTATTVQGNVVTVPCPYRQGQAGPSQATASARASPDSITRATTPCPIQTTPCQNKDCPCQQYRQTSAEAKPASGKPLTHHKNCQCCQCKTRESAHTQMLQPITEVETDSGESYKRPATYCTRETGDQKYTIRIEDQTSSDTSTAQPVTSLSTSKESTSSAGAVCTICKTCPEKKCPAHKK